MFRSSLLAAAVYDGKTLCEGSGDEFVERGGLCRDNPVSHF